MINHHRRVRAPDPISIHLLSRRPRPARPALAPVLRSMLLGLTVFTVAALAGGLLAGAAPAEPGPHHGSGATELTGGRVVAWGSGEAAGSRDPELTFAYSMIFSGTVALTLSITGTVIVLRRRRLW